MKIGKRRIILLLAAVLALTPAVPALAAETDPPSGYEKELTIADAQQYGQTRFVAAGSRFAAAVGEDGRCLVAGQAPDVSAWDDLTALSANDSTLAGLRGDGTVVCSDLSLDVGAWQDIMQIDYWETLNREDCHLLGLRWDGTVVAAGTNRYGECDVDGWTDIVDVAAGGRHSVLLRADGTVVAVGSNENGQCGVEDWRDVVDVAAARYTTFGLTSGGEILTAGGRISGVDFNHPIPRWEKVTSITGFNELGTGLDCVVGLCTDGHIVSNGVGMYVSQKDLDSFEDVISVAASSWGYFLCEDSRGTVRAVGWDVNGERNTDGWGRVMTGESSLTEIRANGQIPSGDYEDYEYDVLSDGTIRIVGYYGDGRELVIPERIDGRTVTEIGYGAFYGCQALERVKIPRSVRIVEGYAFGGCSALMSVSIPRGVSSIGEYAFGGCESLAGVQLPESVTDIGDYAFSGCSSLRNVTVSDSLISIGEDAFSGCGRLTLHLAAGSRSDGSLAEKYALNSGIPFKIDAPAPTASPVPTLSPTAVPTLAPTAAPTPTPDPYVPGPHDLRYASEKLQLPEPGDYLPYYVYMTVASTWEGEAIYIAYDWDRTAEGLMRDSEGNLILVRDNTMVTVLARHGESSLVITNRGYIGWVNSHLLE